MENSKRQIKFRAWDGKQFYYTPDFNMHFSESGIIAGLHNGGMVFNRDREITQFTGLLDKNGKEIYEGDIIELSGIKREVAWIEEDAGFGLKYERKFGGFCPMVIEQKVEVIGNIYENPELLNV